MEDGEINERKQLMGMGQEPSNKHGTRLVPILIANLVALCVLIGIWILLPVGNVPRAPVVTILGLLVGLNLAMLDRARR